MKLTTYPISHIGFWKAFGIHMRPYLLFLSGVAGLTGMALAPELDLSQGKAIAGLLAFFLAYGFGQALTDCFQIDTDKLSAPYRPLSKGIINARAVATIALLGLVLVSVILVGLNYWNIILCLLSVIGLATYTYFKRNFWFAGPFYNAWIVALLPIMGYWSMSGKGVLSFSNEALPILIVLSFFSYANFVLMGYLKDIRADREAGYRTFPVEFGWNASVWVSNLFILISTISVILLTYLNIVAFMVGIAGSVIAISGQLYAHLTCNKVEENAAFPIAMSVRSFIIWHLAITLALHAELWIFGLIYYTLFEFVLWARPMRAQI